VELIAALDKYKAIKAQFSKPDFDTLLQYIGAGSKQKEYKTRFMITVGTKIRSIEVAEIAYFYSDEKITSWLRKKGKTCLLILAWINSATCLTPNCFSA
jgi:two-component system, LytTR family, response regulator